jgi:N-methylhydantoinase B/oxoprolinase/acetone carboxylase alpha subunit
MARAERLVRASNAAELDPITLEVYWNRLITIMDEADLAVVRTAMSTIVAESRDFAVMLMDANAVGLTQAVLSLAHFTAMIPRTTRLMLKRFPPETLQEGDVLLTNDPWQGTGHLPDLTVVRPAFHKGKLVAYIGTAAHVPDIGGTITYFGAHDVFEEGLRLMPCKIYRAGEPNQDVLEILAANVRVPELVLGDLRSLVAAATVAERQLGEFLDDAGLSDIQEISTAIQDLSERTMREAIAKIPSGTYRHSVLIDGHPDRSASPDHAPDPHLIAVKVSVDGDRMTVDFEGTSPETRNAAVNGTWALTAGETHTALKAALVPDIPSNEALFRPIEVLAPEGSILNCRFPSPVKGRSITSLHCHEAVFGALAETIPDQVQAGTGIALILVIHGQHPGGKPFNSFLIAAGGVGALSQRDGLNVANFPINTSIAPTEILENQVPLLLMRKEMLPDSRGRGRRLVLRTAGQTPATITMRPNNRQFPPPGILGGEPGTLCTVMLNGHPYAPTVVTLQPGDEITFDLPGGGGFGPVP